MDCYIRINGGILASKKEGFILEVEERSCVEE